MSVFTATIIATFLVPGFQQPPRDPARPAPTATVARDTAAIEADLAAKIAASPATLPLYYQLSKLQEARGAFGDAEATLLRAREAAPSDKSAAAAVAGFYNRRGAFEQAIAALETVAQLDAGNWLTHLMVAHAYWDKVNKDKALAPAQQHAYIMQAAAAIDRSLALDADNLQALTFKSQLLKQRATLETDPVQKQALAAESDALRNRALEISKVQTGQPAVQRSASMSPMGAAGAAGGTAPLRVGGNIGAPKKIRDVRPVYPPEAETAGIQGVIILETTIAADGRVSDAKVLRSIPMLDQAALDAVRQWEFTPTLLNGVPVPVIMTVTVNFSRQ